MEQEIANIRTLVDLAGVVILYAYHIQLFELHTRRELDAIKKHFCKTSMYSTASPGSPSTSSTASITTSNTRSPCYRGRGGPRPPLRPFLDQMEEEIQHYEAQNKTGNSVLDTVLTGKSLYCASTKSSSPAWPTEPGCPLWT